MEIDQQLKSAATEDQMEMELMMMMMMQMDKFPNFYGAHNNNNDPAEFDQTDHTNNISSMPHFIDTTCNIIASPSLSNVPSSVSFNGTSTTPLHETYMPPYLSYNNSTEPSPQKRNSVAAMRETIFRIAAMQPIHIDPESVKPPKRRNVKISKDPQSVASRHRRERISERIRILQRLVPGGTKMDTASMLDEAIHYVKFLKTQVQSLERAAANKNRPTGIGFPATLTTGNCLPIGKAYQQPVPNGPHYGNA